MKKVWFGLGVIALSATLGATVGMSESTAMKAVREGINQSDPLWRVKEVVGEHRISEDDKAMFYISEQNSLVIARLHETWYGRWQLRGVSGSMAVPPTAESPPKISLSGASHDDYWIVYGFVHSDEVHSVKVSNDAAHIIGNPGQTRVYCQVLPKFSGELHAAEAYDKQGKLLEER